MGLVQYDSSDDEEDVPTQAHTHVTEKPKPSVETLPSNITTDDSHPPPTNTTTNPQLSPPPPPPPGPDPGPLLGPALGPSRPPPGQTAPAGFDEEEEEQEAEVDLAFLDRDTTTQPQPSTITGPDGGGQEEPPPPPRSPYTATRSLLRDLTLPAVANMDIPPSPPGSPPAGHEQLTAKFDHLLRIKRAERGTTHFNERLASSAGLRNPALMDKLLAFVGVETEFLGEGGDDDDDDRRGGGGGGGDGGGGGTEQYATVLSADVWDPLGFPAWAFRGPLRRAQEQVRRERERGKGEAVEFVSAGLAGAGTGEIGVGSRAGTPAGTSGGGGVGGKRKARFDP